MEIEVARWLLVGTGLGRNDKLNLSFQVDCSTFAAHIIMSNQCGGLSRAA